MKGKILLSYQENTRKVEEEERQRFLRNLLDSMGVPIQEFWSSEETLDVEQRIELRKILQAYNISVIDDLDGHMQIFVENDLVGEWKKPTYTLKKDLREKDPRKRLYLEMEVDAWTIEEDN